MLMKIMCVVAITASLVACSQPPQSKIQKLGTDKAARLIQDSAAGFEMMDGKAQMSMGGVYGACMQGQYTKEFTKNDCAKLYKSMLKSIKKYPGLASIDMKDITSQSFYRFIKPVYSKNVSAAQKRGI